MKIIKVGLGNTDEAYIESKLSDGINIIFSDEKNSIMAISVSGRCCDDGVYDGVCYLRKRKVQCTRGTNKIKKKR